MTGATSADAVAAEPASAADRSPRLVVFHLRVVFVCDPSPTAAGSNFSGDGSILSAIFTGCVDSFPPLPGSYILQTRDYSEGALKFACAVVRGVNREGRWML